MPSNYVLALWLRGLSGAESLTRLEQELLSRGAAGCKVCPPSVDDEVVEVFCDAFSHSGAESLRDIVVRACATVGDVTVDGEWIFRRSGG